MLCGMAPLFLKAQNYAGKALKISFFSSTPIEDIKAASNKGSGVLVASGGKFAFQVPVKSFEFDKGLMQEHFNENYMESDKYPQARFTGSFNKPVDLSKDGEYHVTANGTLLIHGIGKQRSIPGTLTVKNGVVTLNANFDVACADHQIKIPTLIITKIAEVIQVHVNGTLSPVK
ncbi:YceI family protein [Pedobacter sp. BS3]|nr:YceI family protein [Pedobacter sp. BS3]